MSKKLKKTPTDRSEDELTRAVRVAKDVTTVSFIRLENCGSSRDKHPVSPLSGPAEAKFDVEIKSAFGEGVDGSKALNYIVKLNMTAFFKTLEQPILIEATFRIVFQLKPESSAPPEDDALAFGQVSGLRMVWPYWREFVQSMSVRMGFPPVPIPILGDGLFPEFQKATKRNN
jgi:preprotein translocase subunit SecB